MRDLDLRKQLKSFGKGLIKGAAASITGGASLEANVAKNFVQPKVGNLPSITEADGNQKPTKKSSTGMRATSKKLKKKPNLTGMRATSKRIKRKPTVTDMRSTSRKIKTKIK